LAGTAEPSRIRQVGQLPSSEPDLGVPQAGHVSGTFVTKFDHFFSNSAATLQRY
jgi:hypothetical protein